jgi:short-subunit dehydrogenase
VKAVPSDRVIVVTGASSGIGRALAREAARGGWRVLSVARRRERLEDLTRDILESGGAAEMLVADVCDPRTPQRIVDTAMRAFGRIDAVVNNAGTGAHRTLLEQSDEAVDLQWQMHVAAPLRITRAALPMLQASHGVIVFVGSGLARVPAPYYGAYCAAKAAVRAVSTQLRRELRADGIAVTYVDPGVVDTEFSAAAGKERERDAMAVRPERVAKAMLRGIERRARVVNVVPSHALAAMLGEFFPQISDAAMPHFMKKPEALPAATAHEPTRSEPEPKSNASDFEQALAPMAHRMERVKLSPDFLRKLINENGGRIDLSDAALRWTGMPNKNERAALREALEVLARAGYLENAGEDTWLVRRRAD